MYPFLIQPAGDAALLVQLPEVIDPDVNAWCVALADAVMRSGANPIVEAVVGYCSVTVYFDPVQVDCAGLAREIRVAAAGLSGGAAPQGKHVDVPVAYGGTFGPDLEAVAQFARCSAQEVIARHTARRYRVYLVGFVPGFAYMSVVDPGIAAPRRSTPRTSVPAGSVAIAGPQTGIYPASTPGGWNIIGRTRLRPFDASRPEPSLFKAGDTVSFHEIRAADADDAAAALGAR
jgi:inhibitor of KinA